MWSASNLAPTANPSLLLGERIKRLFAGGASDREQRAEHGAKRIARDKSVAQAAPVPAAASFASRNSDVLT